MISPHNVHEDRNPRQCKCNTREVVNQFSVDDLVNNQRHRDLTNVRIRNLVNVVLHSGQSTVDGGAKFLPETDPFTILSDLDLGFLEGSLLHNLLLDAFRELVDVDSDREGEADGEDDSRDRFHGKVLTLLDGDSGFLDAGDVGIFLIEPANNLVALSGDVVDLVDFELAVDFVGVPDAKHDTVVHFEGALIGVHHVVGLLTALATGDVDMLPGDGGFCGRGSWTPTTDAEINRLGGSEEDGRGDERNQTNCLDVSHGVATYVVMRRV